jgi:hypothetical protein
MDCGDSSCRHELQERLSTLNPAFAERVAALSSSGISSKGAWQRALRAGTAADARKVVQEAREASEQVRAGSCRTFAQVRGGVGWGPSRSLPFGPLVECHGIGRKL